MTLPETPPATPSDPPQRLEDALPPGATPADPRLDRGLAGLAGADRRGRIGGPVTALAPGIELRCDPSLRPRGHWRSAPGDLVELDLTPEGDGRWMTLQITLGAEDLTPWKFLGLLCRSSAGGLDLVQPVLRSGTGGPRGFSDCPFPRHMLSRPAESLHLDAIELDRTDIPATAPWRQLLLFLPTSRLLWRLADLRLFLL